MFSSRKDFLQFVFAGHLRALLPRNYFKFSAWSFQTKQEVGIQALISPEGWSRREFISPSILSQSQDQSFFLPSPFGRQVFFKFTLSLKMLSTEVLTLWGISDPTTWSGLGLCLLPRAHLLKAKVHMLAQEGMQNGTAMLENSLADPYKVKHVFTIRLNNVTPNSLLKWNKNLHLNHNLYTNVSNSFIRNH